MEKAKKVALRWIEMLIIGLFWALVQNVTAQKDDKICIIQKDTIHIIADTTQILLIHHKKQ